jgi:DNA repair protein RecO (recombination protein O)
MILKTNAIVSRWSPVSETSRIVTWITRDHGRIATMIKGSQRPKSAFLGQYDLFYTCELLYYPRDGGAAHIARECCPLKTRDRFRTDWKAAAAASYICDLVTRVSPPDAPHADLFDLLERSLDDLAQEGGSAAFLAWFELRLLGALGLAPRLQHCIECKRDLKPTPQQSRFAYIRGGILCPDCAREDKKDALPLGPDVLAMLTGWQRAQNPRAARSTRGTPRQMDVIQNLLGLFLSYHLEIPLRSREIALDLLGRKIGMNP